MHGPTTAIKSSLIEFKYYLKDLMETSTPAFSLIIGLLIILFTLTGFGIYVSFGPPAKKLLDPFEEDDD